MAGAPGDELLRRQFSRRQFLKGAGGVAVGGTAALMGLDRFFLMSALAAPADPNDYKALVCVFLFGGNDANNMVIPSDEYGLYSAVRGGSQFAIPQDQLLGIRPRRDGRRFGLHPSMAKLQGLWAQDRMAVVANVGTLVEPITRSQYLAGAARPRQLFSHADQQLQHQSSVSGASSRSGWGGRVAERLRSTESFPLVASVAGVNLFSTGDQSSPLVISPAPTTLDSALRLTSPDPGIEALLGLDTPATSGLLAANSAIAAQALANSRALSSDPVLGTAFPATGLGNQLKQIAKLISLRQSLGLRRQVFFASLGGFDTHTGQLAGQGALLTQLSDGLAAFYAATEELGVASQVTSFTVSDFSRTFKPGGGQTGTDHAWGSHQLVVGGDVLGGDFYGAFPTLALEGPDDTDTGSGARGRWIPSVSIDQYGATMARWFGVGADDVRLVFPNVDRFATADLSFLRSPHQCASTSAFAPCQKSDHWAPIS